ncbi:TonB-dependent receptor [Caulobacter hibisci]|uniref:TonB-dependent receptor n=1 Tax=Caulobacter hibisci TaxID=2035993 RepID=A0ABS0T4I9_9CAUL|nr:TonB-dependent receptor [Caulobacter hibisci]MBI1686754.1 TonB-dependent receptor [Caulobacter hibisci]
MLDKNRLAAVMVTTSVLALAAQAQAQTQAQATTTADQDAVVTEIVVTAQKREERLQEVPLSITVAGSAQLERQQVNQVSDLARIAPSLEVQQAPGQSVGGGGQIRGIGTQSFQAGAVGSVGIVVDQVSQGNVNISDLFDIARVEVLKGPQGTLFGLTTSAGVINIATNAPQFGQFSGRVRTELSKDGTAGSKYGQQVVQGLLNIPLAETAALRVSASVNQRQGVNRNTLTGDLDDHAAYALRGRLLWEPSDKLTVNLIGDYSKTDDDGTDFFVLYKANTALTAELAQCGIVASQANRDYCSTSKLINRNKSYGGSVQLDYDLGAASVTSITALRKLDAGPTFLDIFRLDVNPLKVRQGPSTGDGELFTQEVRIASPSSAVFEYTAGLFYSSQTNHTDPAALAINVTPFPGLTIPISNLLGYDLDIKDRSAAAFGQATYHVGEKLRLIAGARYTHETMKVGYASLDSGTSGGRKTTIDNWSWKLGPQYQFDKDTMAYATVSRGYKGPQVAVGDPTIPTNQPALIRPEIPTNYEAGLKGALLDGRLLADVSAFYMNLKDYQGQLCTPNQSGGLTCAPQNIGKVISKGVEVNLFGQPVHGLSLNTGVIYNPVTYPKGFTAQDGSDLGGEQMANAPKWKFTLSGEYRHAVAGTIEGFVAADTVYKSAVRYAASTDETVTFDAHWTVGGRIGVRDPDKGWTAAIFVRNLTDSHEPTVRYANFPDGSIGSYGQILTPQSFRLVGLSLDARF